MHTMNIFVPTGNTSDTIPSGHMTLMVDAALLSCCKIGIAIDKGPGVHCPWPPTHAPVFGIQEQ